MLVARYSIPGLILVAASIVAIDFSAWAEDGSGSTDPSPMAGLSRMVQIGLAMDPVDDGVIITLAPEHQPGAQAGIREGDVIRRMDGEPVRSQAEVVRKLRADRPSEVQFDVVRDGEEMRITVFPQPVPLRESDDFDIHYGAVAVADGELRRTITTQPRGEGPFPTIVMLGGIGCYSLDRSDDFPYIHLLDQLTRAGYLTYWVEKSGMGDSQGAPCMEIDFEVELSGYRAGLEQVRSMPQVDQDRIVLLGHSMGGITGPVLAAEAASSEQHVQAVVAIGTTGLPWFEYLIDNSRRQLHLSGLSPAEVEATMRETVAVHYRYTMEKHSPEEILADYPDRSGSFGLPHHYSYFQQVADISPLAEWAAASVPALLIAGGADYVTSPEEHRYVADILNGIQPGMASYVLIEDMNHGLRQARDAEAARAGDVGGFHDQLVPAILDWIGGVEGRPSPARPVASLKFTSSLPGQFEFADQPALPEGFGAEEFTLELWVKPDDSAPVGETWRGSFDQLYNWSDSDREPYSSHGWWLAGNWLLDGHTRPAGFDAFDTREGTFSLQFYGGGRVRWTFADADLDLPGKVYAVQAFPASSTPSLLDGQWHHIACVRRWAEDGGALLELWVDGELIAETPIPERIDMTRFWSSLPHPDNPPELGGWAWGAEVMTAWNTVFTQYEDYKGLMDELRFWNRALTRSELSDQWRRAVTGSEPGLAGWYDFSDLDGNTITDRLNPDQRIELHRFGSENFSAEGAPVR